MQGTCFVSSSRYQDSSTLNVRATYAEAKFARIRPIIQGQAVQMETEPKPIMVRAGQDITRTHQSLIDLAIDSMETMSTSDHIGLPDLVTDEED